MIHLVWKLGEISIQMGETTLNGFTIAINLPYICINPPNQAASVVSLSPSPGSCWTSGVPRCRGHRRVSWELIVQVVEFALAPDETRSDHYHCDSFWNEESKNVLDFCGWLTLLHEDSCHEVNQTWIDLMRLVRTCDLFYRPLCPSSLGVGLSANEMVSRWSSFESDLWPLTLITYL